MGATQSQNDPRIMKEPHGIGYIATNTSSGSIPANGQPFGVNPYQTTTVGTFSQTFLTQPTPLTDPCTLGGHFVSEYIEFHDGSIHALCAVCQVRIVLPEVPGGDAKVRLQTILELLIAGDECSDLILPLVAGLRQSIDAGHEALEETEALYDIVQQRLDQAGVYDL